MRRGATLAVMVFGLVGCASQPEPAQHLFANIKFVGAQNDLSKSKEPEVITRDDYVIGTEAVSNVVLSTAGVCDQAKTNCRFAIVSTEVRYKVEKFDGHTVTISGKLISKTSRNITAISIHPPQTVTQSLGLVEGAEFIGEGSEQKPITGVMDLNQQLDLKGGFGAKVFIWFSEKRL